ncbi:MAG TPA: hypothetical protein VME19_21945 [Streptosporangiaceae bacterium]|nr:hypothetical protein [Streptosporangiaceae bacterium]
MRAFHSDGRTRDWRVVGDGAIAVFRTGSFAAGARLVQAIAAAVGDGDHVRARAPTSGQARPGARHERPGQSGCRGSA